MLQAGSKVKKTNEARKEEELPADEGVHVEEDIKMVEKAEAATHDFHDMECNVFGT